MDPGRRRDRVQARAAADAGDGALGSAHVEGHQPPREALWIQIAEDQPGLGHLRLVTPAPIACRTRRGARAPGPHAKAPTPVDPRDAAPAGADRAHVHHGGAHGIRPDPALAGDERLAAPYHRHIVARATHVERDEVADPRALGGEPGADHAARRADRKSTRLNSSHLVISYAVFCLKK